MDARRRAGQAGGLNRRDLLRSGSAMFVMVGLAGRHSVARATSAPGSGDSGLEAPMLAERVQAGELPPLEARLPVNPLVVEPHEQLGQYGGEWNTAIRAPSDSAWLYRTIGYDELTRWGWQIDVTETTDNVAESIDASADGREYVIHLRDGMKWSDGELFTADDILFAYNDVLSNEALVPAVPSWLAPGGKPATFEKVDDLTVRVMFEEPVGLFRGYAGLSEGLPLIWHPKHYLEQFHIDYNPDADEMAQDEGYPDWVGLYAARGITTYPGDWQNSELPTLSPWQLIQAFGEGTQLVAERNPYYWKVDTEGRQLPYIDRVVFQVVDDPEAMLLMATNGDIDMHARHINSSTNKPVLAQARESGGFDFFDLIWADMNELGIAFNLTHADPVKREIFNNKDFRIGLSHAINREEIIEASFEGQGEPWQIAPRPEGPYYDEQMAKQYTEYDVDLANEHLDTAGYAERDDDGFRLGPDSNRITIDINTTAEGSGTLERLVAYWSDVGVEARIQTMDRALFFERVHAVDFDVVVWNGDAGSFDAIFFPRWWFPSEEFSFWGVAWANWYNGVEPSEEPPEEIRRQMELFDQVKATTDDAERIELFRELLAINRDLFPAIGIALTAPGYGIVKNNFHNVPAPMLGSAPLPFPATGSPEQFFISGE